MTRDGIFQLEQEEGIIEGGENLKKFITKYYKGLFGPQKRNNFSMDESRTEDIPQVSHAENEFLTEYFSEKEVRDAIFQMKHNKAPGPDGFPIEFYQVFWSLIKEDLMAMFKDFHDNKLPLFNLNFGILTLIPKLKEVKMIQQYRPICMLNVSFYGCLQITKCLYIYPSTLLMINLQARVRCQAESRPVNISCCT